MSIPDYLRLLRREPDPPHVCPVGLSEVARGDVLRLLAEYGRCVAQATEYRTLAVHYPEAAAGHELQAQRAIETAADYIADIDSLLKGIKP